MFLAIGTKYPTLRTVKPLRSLRGIDKGRDTLEAYFKRHHADNDREREHMRERQHVQEHVTDRQKH